MNLSDLFPVCTDIEPILLEGAHQQDYYNVTPCVTGQDLDIWYETIHYLPDCHPTKGPWILGGAVRRFFLDLPQSADIDLFFPSAPAWADAYAELGEHYEKLIETHHHVTYQVREHKVQLVCTRYQPTMIDHMNLFDFTVCQTGWDGYRFVMSEPAIHALKHHVLQTNPTQLTPLDLSMSWSRVLKYAQLGYMPNIQLVNHFIQCAQECPTSVDKGKNYA